MKAVVFITVVGLLPTLLAEMIPFEDCSRQEEVAVKVHGVGLVPKVPKGGSTVEVIVRSRASTRISAGSYEFKMELDDGEQYREHRNICDIMACPIEPGNFIFKTMQQVPNIPIPGTYAAKLRAADAAGGTIFCARIELEIIGNGNGAAVERVLDLVGIGR